MEQRGSNEPSPPDPTSERPITETPAPESAAVGSSERPDAARRPFVAVAITGVLIGSIVVLGLVSIRTNPPIQTAEAASITPGVASRSITR